VSEKMDTNHRELMSLLTTNDQWHAEKTELISQLAEVPEAAQYVYFIYLFV